MNTPVPPITLEDFNLEAAERRLCAEALGLAGNIVRAANILCVTRHPLKPRITTLNLLVVQHDVERGLLLVEGAVPGSKGGWIMVRDAVKKPLPEAAPKPGKFRVANGDGGKAAEAPAQQEGA